MAMMLMLLLQSDVEALIAALGSDDIAVRDEAFLRLRERGQSVHTRLRESLSSSDLEVRERCRALLPRKRVRRTVTPVPGLDPAVENWEETLRILRGGAFHDPSTPEKYTFERTAAMGEAAYPYLIRYIDHEDTTLGTTAVLALKKLSGRSEEPGRVTDANKVRLKSEWEAWFESQ